MEPTIKILDPILSNAENVLELGCGTGRLVNEMVRRYPNLQKIVAIDIFKAPQINDPKITFQLQNLDQANIQGTYDLIIINQVLEHMKNPLGLIESITKNLSPKGKIFIAVPNRYGFRNSARLFHTDEGKHYFLWDKEGLEFSLDKLGMTCTFIHLYEAPTKGGLLRHLPKLLRIQNPNLMCFAERKIS